MSNRNPLGYPLDWLLSKRADCEVHTSSDIGAAEVTNNPSVPDILVVDFGSLPQSTDSFLESFASRSPSTPVIGVYPARCTTSHRIHKRFATDDVVVHEEDKDQPGQTAEYLLAKIDTLDRIACVHQRLQQKMNESRIIAKSRPMQDVLQKLPQLASTVSTVLITGETGTGKELIARAIHYLGERAGKPFITVDCGSIPETLIENELFGHVRGAYTTANTTTHGLIQEAEGGTVFLDEVEALPLSVQTKFLRFLQERQVRQLGQTKYNPIDVRIVSSTNGNLKDFVERSLFRQDLYYRLNVIPVYLPPLRDRKADIPDLVRYFVNRHTNGAPCGITIPDDVMQRWIEHDWPGNVRELENRVQEWLIQKTADTSSYTSLSTMSTSGDITTLGKVRDQALERSEQLYLRQLLSLTNGNISQAAKLAGIDRKNLAILLKKRGVDPRGFRHQ